MTERHNKVISEDDAETLAGLLRSAHQELNRDQRYLGMFEDEVDRAQVNSLWNVAGSNRRTGAIYQVNFPRSAHVFSRKDHRRKGKEHGGKSAEHAHQ